MGLQADFARAAAELLPQSDDQAGALQHAGRHFLLEEVARRIAADAALLVQSTVRFVKVAHFVFGP